MTLASGSVLASYEILRPLGAGAMGLVYEARDTRLDRPVALKLLPAEFALEPERLARFDREARMLGALNHPNIVTIYALERSGDTPFLVMERVSGRPLADLMSAGALPMTRVLEWGVHVALALGAAHERGIVHRDLKPANVMVNDDGCVKVLDFGLARIDRPAGEAETTAALTEGGRLMGTLPYMAPEQVRGERADRRADIFALGVMLYEMAAGVRPFRGSTSADVMSAILGADPPPLDALLPGVPARFARLVHRCLEKEPRGRVQSAWDVAQELQDLAQTGESPGVRRAAPDAPSGWRRRNVALAVGGLVMVVALAATSLWPRLGPAALPAATIRSLAVLPFDNLMRDDSQDYVVDGLHEEVITELARLGVVRVTSRSSVLRYRGQRGSLKDVARELEVDALIEGSVLLVGNRVRIGAQLILGRADQHIWAESYERDRQDVLVLLSDVSNAIAAEVRSHLGLPEANAAVTPTEPRVRPDAYDAYLRGRRALVQITRTPDLAAAREGFQRAVELDPAFGRAWSSLAMVDLIRGLFEQAPAADVLPDARTAALRALSLDERDGRAHGVLGTVELYFDWSFDSARARLERAVALDPNDFAVRHALADYYMVTGRLADSLDQVRAGRLAEPEAPLAHIVVAMHTAATGRYEDAIAEARQAIELFPDVPLLRGVLGDLFWHQGRYTEALAEYQRQFGDRHEVPKLLAGALKAGDAEGAARSHADWLAARPASGAGHMVSVANLFARARENEMALVWLEKAYAVRAPQLLHVMAWPDYESLRGDPRFVDLLRRIGIPQAAGR
jgi:eukaryotic-like serine/threonine-protein kinase